MKIKVERKVVKYIKLILICFLFTFATVCENKVDVDQATSCGVGNGDFDFETVNSVPDTFDCNNEGSFKVCLKPNTDSSFAGFNRLWFQLERYGEVYRSNYVEFHSGDTITQMLEWGGSLPTGGYEMRGYMNNIELYSCCEDSIYSTFDARIGDIFISEFTNPQKVMEIEYFCQDSDTNCIDRYDVFLIPNTEEYIDIAFNVANTTYNLTTYSTDLDPEIIEYEPFASNEIKYYIFNLKQWENEMLLCGIKGFKDTQGHVMPDLFGITYEDDTIGCVPTCSTGSLVAVKTCMSSQYNNVSGLQIENVRL